MLQQLSPSNVAASNTALRLGKDLFERKANDASLGYGASTSPAHTKGNCIISEANAEDWLVL